MSTISASTTTTTGFVVTSNTTGTLVLQTGATPTTAVTIDGSQQVGVGTSTNTIFNQFVNYKSGANANYVQVGNGSTGLAATNGLRIGVSSAGLGEIYSSSATASMVFDTSGNVSIGTSTATATGLTLIQGKNLAWQWASNGYNYSNIFTQAASAGLILASGYQYSATSNGFASSVPVSWDRSAISVGSGGIKFYADANATVAVGTDITPTERMRIDGSGNLLVGTTSSDFGLSPGFKYLQSNVSLCLTVNTATGTQGSYHLYNTNATNNGYRFYVVSNGGIYNFSGNNSNLSDERTKKNIEVSGSYLDKICAIPVKLFNYKDEAEGEQQTLGVIAQDVEAVAPELVNLAGFGDTPEDGIPLKSIYTTDMMFALMKCIQELKAELDAAKADIATLKGAA